MNLESSGHSIIDLTTAVTCTSSQGSILPVMTAFQLDNMLWQMQDSPMQQLLDDAQREVVADVVNAALLASASGKPKWDVKPQVRKTCQPQPLQLHDYIMSDFAAIPCKLVDTKNAMLKAATLRSHFLDNDTSLFPLTFECMSSHNQGHKHASWQIHKQQMILGSMGRCCPHDFLIPRFSSCP